MRQVLWKVKGVGKGRRAMPDLAFRRALRPAKGLTP